jgi:hypothetical protein
MVVTGSVVFPLWTVLVDVTVAVSTSWVVSDNVVAGAVDVVVVVIQSAVFVSEKKKEVSKEEEFGSGFLRRTCDGSGGIVKGTLFEPHGPLLSQLGLSFSNTLSTVERNHSSVSNTPELGLCGISL